MKSLVPTWVDILVILSVYDECGDGEAEVFKWRV
jgi:hypothetical protein